MDSRKHKSKYANHKISEEEQQQQEVASWEQDEYLCLCSDKLQCEDNILLVLYKHVYKHFSLIDLLWIPWLWQQELTDILKVMESS